MVSATFAAAHQLKGYGGKCEALHGHNWRVQLFVKTKDVDEIGLALDFGEMKGCLRTILQALDHTNLNDLPAFQRHNPSSENIAQYIFQKRIVECIHIYIKQFNKNIELLLE